MYSVVVSRTFQKQFKGLPKDIQRRVRAALAELENDPLTPRAKADIKPLHDIDPPVHWPRIGEYRIIYHIE